MTAIKSTTANKLLTRALAIGALAGLYSLATMAVTDTSAQAKGTKTTTRGSSHGGGYTTTRTGGHGGPSSKHAHAHYVGSGGGPSGFVGGPGARGGKDSGLIGVRYNTGGKFNGVGNCWKTSNVGRVWVCN